LCLTNVINAKRGTNFFHTFKFFEDFKEYQKNLLLLRYGSKVYNFDSINRFKMFKKFANTIK